MGHFDHRVSKNPELKTQLNLIIHPDVLQGSSHNEILYILPEIFSRTILIAAKDMIRIFSIFGSYPQFSILLKGW